MFVEKRNISFDSGSVESAYSSQALGYWTKANDPLAYFYFAIFNRWSLRSETVDKVLIIFFCESKKKKINYSQHST